MNSFGTFAIVVAVLLFIGMLVAATIASSRKMKAAVDAKFADLGFSLVRKPDQAAKDAVWPAFAAFDQLKYGAKRIEWIARGVVDKRPVIAIKHSYTVSTGQSTATIVHLCFATPCPEPWPMVELKGETVFHRIAGALGKSDLELESPVFNRRWRVSAENEEHGLLLLTPEIQAALESAPAGETWAIGRGWARMSVLGKRTRPQYFNDNLAKPGQLLDMVPRELFLDSGV